MIDPRTSTGDRSRYRIQTVWLDLTNPATLPASPPEAIAGLRGPVFVTAAVAGLATVYALGVS